MTSSGPASCLVQRLPEATPQGLIRSFYFQRFPGFRLDRLFGHGLGRF
jgi:hypothetical protein